MKTCKTLAELYSHSGFRARSKLIGVYGDPYARVIKLERRQKKPFVQFVIHHRRRTTIVKSNGQEIFPAVHSGYTLSLNTAVYFAKSVTP
ncbi:MAG: hypothetical protein CV087_01855 [Candidatus Brocadia sp. WS118]|nr:MAG: hypothetical protein CV087_01855 [Candidatus Brocadia sp. WS118]